MIGVSQSGETIDTIQAIREAKRRGARVIGVIEHRGLFARTRVRRGDLHPRRARSVRRFDQGLRRTSGRARGARPPARAAARHLRPDDIDALFKGINAVASQVATALERRASVEDVAKQLLGARDFFFIGRHVGFPTSLEGALKLKELSYLHAEGYPAGELKHGPLALIEPGVVVVAVVTDPSMHEKMLSNLSEVKARGATVVAVATDDDEYIDAIADYVLRVPATEPLFTPMVDVVPLQLFAYAMARGLGRNVDRPRNLAKTVTVE